MPLDPGAHIAAPKTITLSGKQYTLYPLRLLEFRELEGYLRNLPLKQIKPMLTDLPSEDRAVLLAKAYDETKSVRIGTDAFDQSSQTFEGMTCMFWLSLRRGIPELTIESAGDLLGQVDFNEVANMVNAMAGFSKEDPNPTAAGTKTTTIPANPSGSTESTER